MIARIYPFSSRWSVQRHVRYLIPPQIITGRLAKVAKSAIDVKKLPHEWLLIDLIHLVVGLDLNVAASMPVPGNRRL